MKSVTSIAAMLLVLHGFGQSFVFNIGSVPTYSGCDAIMHDSNGGLQHYSPSSNNEIVLCAQAPETQLNLYFIGFDLAIGDVLSVYDGNSTGAPLIGTYSGGDLLFQTISSSNPDGCLTVTFVSNADNQVGDFSVHLSCGVPCDYPVALIGAESDTIRICPNESVAFDGSQSFWTEGANLASWTWDFGDNSTNTTTWPLVNHTFADPGGYRVRLYLQDDNNCESANIPEVVVLVSTDYVFDVTATSDYFCVGNEIYLGTAGFVANPNPAFTDETQDGHTTTWVETQTISFDNGVYIPDNQGCLYTDITFNQFGTATISADTDISSVLINMEHTFVGDIIINIICPTGQVLNLWPEAGGSGTWLGEPLDDPATTPGVGYDYTFSPNSTGPTWMNGMASFGSTIPAGDYSAEGLWSDLIGCPLNGTWQLEVCDVVGADDGYVFEFGITFAPQFYPEILQFTPIVGNGCDSSYWETPNALTTIGSGCDWASFTPSASGDYTFTYHVINDFGCEYTKDIDVVAIEQPIINAPDAAFCNNGLVLNATVTNGIPNGSYTYSWSPATGLSNANIQNPTVNNLTNDIIYTVTVSATGLTACSSAEDVNVVVSEPLVPTVPAEQFYCSVEFPFTLESAAQVNEDAQFSWIWNNENGSNLIGNEQNQEVINYGQFVLTVSEPNCNTQIVTTYYVTPPPPANAGSDFFFCGEDIALDGSVVSPIPGLQYGYSWSPAGLLNDPNIHNSLIIANLDTITRFYLTTYPLADPTCISQDSVDVLMPQLPNLNNLTYLSPCMDELPYTVYGAAQTIPFITYDWTFLNPDTLINYGNVPSVVSSLNGIYHLVLTEPNCGLSVSQDITVAPQVCTLFIPNIMTPNGDGDNDTFNVRGISKFSGSDVQIFNRWGNVVYEDKDYDGSWGGGDVPDGTYYYILSVNKKTGVENYSGSLTIIR